MNNTTTKTKLYLGAVARASGESFEPLVPP